MACELVANITIYVDLGYVFFLSSSKLLTQSADCVSYSVSIPHFNLNGSEWSLKMYLLKCGVSRILLKNKI